MQTAGDVHNLELPAGGGAVHSPQYAPRQGLHDSLHVLLAVTDD